MRNGRPGRGERARVARRVRAILADAGCSGDPAATADRLGDTPSVAPWLPGDDVAVQRRLLAPVATVASRAAAVPEHGLMGARHRSSGLIDRLTLHLAVRAEPGRRGAIAVGVAVLVAALVTGGWVLSARPHTLPVTGTGADPGTIASARSVAASAKPLTPSPAPVSSATEPVTAAPILVVDVAGKVRHPGLYRLAPGSRVEEAVRAAGGALPGVDLTSLNLAARIADGQQITVGMPGAPGAGGPGLMGSSAASGPVDLNSATLAQLETLPGVGPVLGQHIIDWRIAHGRFASVDQLREVPGIGDVKFAALRSRVIV